MTGIYKITNKINDKSYIGQSIHIEKRWANHKYRAFRDYYPEYESPLYRAIRKYSIDNFTFEVIEECSVADLDKREQYWIAHYNTFYNGYNQTFGGKNGASSTHSSETIAGIIKDLETTDLYHRLIAQKWNVSIDMVQGINTGRYRKYDREYPIQTTYKRKIGKKYCVDCNKIINGNAIRCLECSNIAKRKVERPSKEELLSLILSTSILQIARNYGVSDNAVRKWCLGYNLPYLRKDILNYGKTEEEIQKQMLAKQRPKRDKPVEQIDIETGKTLAQYPTITIAARALGKSDGSHISSVCLGKRKTAYGFFWEYSED